MRAVTALWWSLICTYVGFMGREVYGLFYPPRCRGKKCWRALLPLGASIDVYMHLHGSDGMEPLWNATNISSHSEFEAAFALPVPADVRRGKQRELWVSITLLRTGKEGAIASTRVNVLKMYKPRGSSSATMLLERDVFTSSPQSHGKDDGSAVAAGSSAVSDAGFAPSDGSGHVPHFVYSGRHCELRLVVDATPHSTTVLSDGVPIGSALDHREHRYAPHFYVDTFSLLRKHAAPLSGNLSKAHPRLKFKLKPISLGRHRIMHGLTQALDMFGETLGMSDELDEVRPCTPKDRKPSHQLCTPYTQTRTLVGTGAHV
jgi:hypothetical protein